jgi:hypothetical protein
MERMRRWPLKLRTQPASGFEQRIESGDAVA